MYSQQTLILAIHKLLNACFIDNFCRIAYNDRIIRKLSPYNTAYSDDAVISNRSIGE